MGEPAAGYPRDVFTVLAVLAVLGILVVVVVMVASRSTGDRGASRRSAQHVVPPVQRGDASDFPRPGEPSPHRADGRPVPGSRDDRHEHGQP